MDMSMEKIYSEITDLRDKGDKESLISIGQLVSASLHNLNSPFCIKKLKRLMKDHHKMDMALTENTADALYNLGAITYPRTDSSELPTDFKGESASLFFAIVMNLNLEKHNKMIKGLVDFKTQKVNLSDETLKNSDEFRIKNTTSLMHHAIIPTNRIFNIDDFSDAMKLVYNVIVDRFLSSLSEKISK